MRAAFAMFFLCACNVSGALEVVVEIDPQIAVDRVQLYVGLGGHANDASERLIPRDYKYPETPSGYFWKRDPNGAQDIVDVEPGAGDVRFVFREGTHDAMTAIVIGFKGDEIVAATALVEAFIEDGTVRQYHVKLKPASAAFPKPARAMITVHLWGPGPGNTRCAYLEDPTQASHPSIFIVDRLDPDCDGLESPDGGNPLECLDDVHLGTIRPDRMTTRCLTSDLLPSSAGAAEACVLGGPGCVDGRGKVANSCDASTTCVPPQSCIACKDRVDALDCMANVTATATATSRIECTIGTRIVTDRVVCPGDPTLTSRFPFLPMCRTDGPYLFWATGKNMWAPSLTSAGLTLMATAPTSDCGMTLKIAGTIPDLNTPLPIRSLINVELANKRSVAFPIVVTFQDGDCTQQNECKVAGDLTPAPSLVACLQSAVIEPW